MHVLFAPDYREANPYQSLLANALGRRGVKITFLSEYHRGLPLLRGCGRVAPDIVHLHWPERYFRSGDIWHRLRIARYPLDLWLTSRQSPVALTAHNFLPHHREPQDVLGNVSHTAKTARAIFAHSAAARQHLIEAFHIPEDNIHLIPFGDHSIALGAPLDREIARNALQLPLDEQVCLMFGAVSQYKGIDEVVRFWVSSRQPQRLAIVGPILSDKCANELKHLSNHCPRIDLHLTDKWLDNQTLRTWLSAVDCVILNYREIFSSGSAALARSLGIPIVLPSRLRFVDLDEPHPHVFRFESLDDDFSSKLMGAINTSKDYKLASEWRSKTSWDTVAEITEKIYKSLLA